LQESQKTSVQPTVSSADLQKPEETIPTPISQPAPKAQIDSTPTITPTASVQNTSGVQPGKAKISSTTPVKVRAQMSQLSKVIEEVQPGTEVTVLENLGNWYQIQTAQNTGFVPAGTLTSGGK
jgi:hypothetical protein